jgi:predicted heme/steroid binding protein/uncharacterized membrane protein
MPDQTFTPQSLQEHDGQEGRPAYVAYRGQVYDVSDSKLWRGGQHVRRHQAGQDLSDAFAAAPHDESVLERMPRVGQLAPVASEAPATHPWLDFYFDQHPHPVTVHFPVALTVVATAFLGLSLLTGEAALETSAYYVLLAGTVTAPFTILTGASSWWFNYGRRLTPTFKGKLGASLLLFPLQVITLVIWTGQRGAVAGREGIAWLLIGLALLMSALVGILGKLGGQLSFPSRK